MRSARRFSHAVFQTTTKRLDFVSRCFVAGHHRKQPANGLQREVFDSQLRHEFARLVRIAIVHLGAHVKRISDQRPSRVNAVAPRNMTFDPAKVLPRLIVERYGDEKVLLSCAREGMSDVNTQERPRLLTTFPETKAAIGILQSFKTLYVARHTR